MKIKLEDLAKELELSIAAVSMAINNKKGVSEETREKVLALAIAKGYKIKKVEQVTQDLSKDKRYIKLLRIKKHGLVAMDTTFFSKIIEGIEDECKKNQFELLISYYKLDDLSSDWVENDNTNVAGIIVLATELLEDDLEIFDGVEEPFVILDSYFASKEWNCILMNNQSASYKAVKYLKECGHRKIGYLKSNTSIYNFDRRYISFIEALQTFGLEEDHKHIVELEPTLEGSHAQMADYLEHNNGLELPTAYVADNDLIAVGAMNAMKGYGIRIPEDVSIIGVDDMPCAQIVQPNLTTSRVYKKEIGRESVRTLLRYIQDETKITQKREVNTTLVIRDSVRVIK